MVERPCGHLLLHSGGLSKTAEETIAEEAGEIISEDLFEIP